MSAPRFTTPRVVIRRNSLAVDQYMTAAGSWGDYASAKRFTSYAAADAFAESHGVTDHGLFPVSRPRRIPA